MHDAGAPWAGGAAGSVPPPTTAGRTGGCAHQQDGSAASAANPGPSELPSEHLARGGGDHGLGQPLPPQDHNSQEAQPAARPPKRTPSSISLTADGSGHGGRHYFQGPQLGRTRSTPQLDNAAMAAQQLQQREGSRREGSRRGGAVWMVEDGSAKGGDAWQPTHDSVDSVRGARLAQPAKPAEPANGGPGGGGVPAVGGGKGDFGHAVVMIEEADERKLFDWGTYFSSLPKKLKGGLDTRLPVPSWRELFWSWLGAFLGILAVCALNQWASPEIDIAFLVGSFGASAVLVFAMLESKMAQPRNFLGGQVLSAIVGVTTRVIIHPTWIAGPVGMSLGLLLMQLTSTTHPPGGATALIAATMTTLPKWHGYSFIVTILVGSLVMQCIALVINNLDPKRRYPTYWW